MAYSIDLRKRAMKLILEEGKSIVETSKILGVSLSSVSRWLRQYRRTKDLTPDLKHGRKPRLTEEDLRLLKELVLTTPDITYGEIHREFRDAKGLQITYAVLVRAVLHTLGLTRKKRQTLLLKEKRRE